MRRFIVVLGLSLACAPLPGRFLIESVAAAESSLLIVEVADGAVSSVPPGAQRVPMLRLRFTASPRPAPGAKACEEDIQASAVTLWHRGRGDRRDIRSVYAVSDGRRISRGRQFASSEGDVTLRLRRFVIPACGTRELMILADFSAEAAITGEHRFVLRSGADIETTARVMLRTPHPPSLRRTVPRSIGAISVEYLRLTETLRYGENRRVARFQLIADGADDHRIEAITLTNEGSASDRDLRNLFLESSRGKRLTAIAPSLEGDSIRLVFDPPLLLRKNDRMAFTLRADIRASRRKTISFVIEEPGDVEAMVVRGRR